MFLYVLKHLYLFRNEENKCKTLINYDIIEASEEAVFKFFIYFDRNK